MTVFQLIFFIVKNATLNKKIVLVTSLFCLFNLNAQEENNIKLRIEPGLLINTASENLGLLLNIEPHIKISNNKLIGFRFGIALNTAKFKTNDSSQFIINDQDTNGVISFLPTFDYYLNEDNYRPYIGLGIGYYLFNYSDVSRRNGSSEILEGRVDNQFGVLIRTGFQINNIRIGLEYNLVTKGAIKLPDGQRIGTVNNSYLGVYIGFKIGGRKS